MNPTFSVISGETVAKYLNDFQRNKEIVRQAYLLHGEHKSVNPPSYFLRFPDRPDSRIIALPGHLGGPVNVSGLKWIASYPGNRPKGLPRASSVLILNDTETGYPFACIECSLISAARTAASAVLAAEIMSNQAKACGRVGFMGNGPVARSVYRHLVGNNWELDRVYLYDIQREASRRFAGHLQNGKHNRVVICDAPDQLLTQCEMIVLATDALKPHILDYDLLSHHPLVLHISLRDISPEIILRSDNITDDVDHVMRANTSLHLAEQMANNRDFVGGSLYDLMKNQARLRGDKPAIFSPFGLGILDLALGRHVYDMALANRDEIRMENFFAGTGG